MSKKEQPEGSHCHWLTNPCLDLRGAWSLKGLPLSSVRGHRMQSQLTGCGSLAYSTVRRPRCWKHRCRPESPKKTSRTDSFVGGSRPEPSSPASLYGTGRRACFPDAAHTRSHRTRRWQYRRVFARAAEAHRLDSCRATMGHQDGLKTTARQDARWMSSHCQLMRISTPRSTKMQSGQRDPDLHLHEVGMGGCSWMGLMGQPTFQICWSFHPISFFSDPVTTFLHPTRTRRRSMIFNKTCSRRLCFSPGDAGIFPQQTHRACRKTDQELPANDGPIRLAERSRGAA